MNLLISRKFWVLLALLASSTCYAQSSSSSSAVSSSSSSSTSSSCYGSSSSSSSSSSGALLCTVNSNQPWGQGYHAMVDVTNTSDQPMSEWQVYLGLADGHTVGHY
jgi:cellulase/cellobiase CelA1